MSLNGNAETSSRLSQLHEDIGRLDLTDNVMELEDRGFTIVPPEKVAPIDLTDRLLAASLRILEARTGRKPDLANGTLDQDMPQADIHTWFLFDDPVYEEALLNPASLCLATYLMTTGNEPLRPAAPQLQGRHPTFQLMTHNVIVKAKGEKPLHFHCDNGLIPSPFPPFAQICNTTILLTDYSRDNGALCFLPGSHRWCRHPTPAERFNFDNAFVVEAPRGSLVVWGGNTWHGALPRTTPGLRVTNVFTYCREYLPSDPGDVPQEMLDRNPPIFAQLMGEGAFRVSRMDEQKMAAAARAKARAKAKAKAKA